ncbi:MAG: MFS transporter [Gammaproteobacteria bacterium]|nr:MFS transporter [Gammaproteobacteria bacterium]MDP2140148.1 MFS transporter [Gammaproteobacteria bacterium]MDP2347132.1 MFS transporter [Gammaproteobacteria bacterium]
MIFLLGFSSGFPWVLHGSVMTLWLQSSGLSRSTIGYFGAVATVYAVNWAWAPLIDRFRLPLLGRLGQRRSWILLTQCAILISLLFLSATNPTQNLVLVSVWALSIAFFSATQDIAVDAYRISIFSRAEADNKMPFAAAVSTTGWWAGYGFLGGAFALYLGGETIGFSWPDVYRILALVYVVMMLLVLFIREPDSDLPVDKPLAAGESNGVVYWFNTYIAAPFREFFARCGFKLAFSILLLLLVFRLGEAMLGRMSLVFYGEVGFTTDQIALYSKFFGGMVTAVFSLMGAVINTRFGVVRGLFVGGIAMASSNLLFALMAVVGPDVNLLMVTMLVDNFSAAFATVAFISFISYFTSRTYTGTQYALMSSVSNFGRTTLAASSGGLVDFLDGDWATFFILTSLMVIPGLLLLLWIARQIQQYKDEHDAPVRQTDAPERA